MDCLIKGGNLIKGFVSNMKIRRIYHHESERLIEKPSWKSPFDITGLALTLTQNNVLFF